jgi:flagellin
MPLSIRTNLSSLGAISSLTKTQSYLSKSISRISTGLKHAGLADGASQKAFGEGLQSDQVSLKAAMSNTSQGISLLQVGEAGINEVYDILTKMREIAVSASNGAGSSTDRATFSSEFNALRVEVSRILKGTAFNGISIIGSTKTLTFQIGVDNSTGDQLAVGTSTFSTSVSKLGISTGTLGGVTTTALAKEAITLVDTALGSLNLKRANIGVAQNRLESVLAVAQAQNEAYSNAVSSILDVDYAEETANMTRFQIMQQAGVAALGQAKSIPQSILSLLG